MGPNMGPVHKSTEKTRLIPSYQRKRDSYPSEVLFLEGCGGGQPGAYQRKVAIITASWKVISLSSVTRTQLTIDPLKPTKTPLFSLSKALKGPKR